MLGRCGHRCMGQGRGHALTAIDRLPEEERRRRVVFSELAQVVRDAEQRVIGLALDVLGPTPEGVAKAMPLLGQAVEDLGKARQRLLDFQNGGGK